MCHVEVHVEVNVEVKIFWAGKSTFEGLWLHVLPALLSRFSFEGEVPRVDIGTPPLPRGLPLLPPSTWRKFPHLGVHVDTIVCHLEARAGRSTNTKAQPQTKTTHLDLDLEHLNLDHGC